MDLFPSNLLSNLVVYKTFSPDIPANFTGGYINLSTKEFPEQFTVQASASVGYNTNATFQPNVLTDNYGKLHALGFADKSRAMPRQIKDGITPRSFDLPQAQMLDVFAARGIGLVVVRVAARGRAEQALPVAAAMELVGVLHDVAHFVAHMEDRATNSIRARHRWRRIAPDT